MRKAATKKEKEHLARISGMACIVSGKRPDHVHHITDCGRRLGHYFTLPLHPDYHTGEYGFSGKNRDTWDKGLTNQLRLLKAVYAILNLPCPAYETKVVRRRYEDN